MDINTHTLWIFFILSSISITHIFVGGSIFGSLRKAIINSENKLINKLKLSDLVMCYQCSGFWIGIFTFPIWIYLMNEISFYMENPLKLIILIFAFGSVNSLLADVFYRIRQYLCDQCG